MDSADHFMLDFPELRLAFGLSWFPVLGARPERLARSLARRRKASHSVVPGATAASVGLAFLPAKRYRSTEPPVHAAAQALASRYALGTIAFVYELKAGLYWLLAVHEGAVVARTDCLCTDLGQADALLAELRKSHPKIDVRHCSGLTEGLPSLAEIASFCGSHSRLCKEGWAMAVRPVHWTLLGLAGALGVSAAVFLWPTTGPTGSQKGPAPVELERLWKEAVGAATSQIGLHGVHGSHVFLKHLYTLPTRLAGWSLRRVDCSARSTGWRCQARLEREDPQAQNAGLIDAAPGHWELDFASMDSVRASWVWRVPEQALKYVRVSQRSTNQRVLQSALQLLKPVFTDLGLGAAQMLEVAAPLDEQGRPYPLPADLVRYASRPFKVEGPLRSVSLLLPHLAAIRWVSANLSINDVVQPGLAASRLKLSMNGNLYEIID